MEQNSPKPARSSSSAAVASDLQPREPPVTLMYRLSIDPAADRRCSPRSCENDAQRRTSGSADLVRRRQSKAKRCCPSVPAKPMSETRSTK
eukprot:2393691-Prymnesium_polylepis.1